MKTKLIKAFAIVALCLVQNIWAQQKGTFTDSRDGKVYKTVKIGSQTWMAENLNYTGENGVCYFYPYYYPDTTANCKKYGRLYNWEAAMKACPKGWHLPSAEEWDILIFLAGGINMAGKKLKSENSWNDYEGKSGNGTDDFGFTALPSGYGSPDGSFSDVNFACSLWGSTVNDINQAYYLYIVYRYENVIRYGGNKPNLLSVRCLKD